MQEDLERLGSDRQNPPEQVKAGIATKTIDIFYQFEGHRELEHHAADPGLNFRALKELLIQKHGLGADVLIFVEDADEPLDEVIAIATCVERAGVKAHLHRSRVIDVTVTFNGQPVDGRFAPGVTVGHVERWAAIDKFNMTKEDAGEHVLQIAGTHDQPTPSTHLGALAPYSDNHLKFDLVAKHRIQG